MKDYLIFLDEHIDVATVIEVIENRNSYHFVILKIQSN